MDDPKKILIIDNDLVIRYTLKKIFSNYLTSNLRIYTSSDGLQGLGYVYVVRPDLIIIDTTLPKYSGRELTEYIKTNPTLSNTPVILLNEGKERLENIPENFIQVSKQDKEFPNNLITEVTKILSNEISPVVKPGYSIVNFLSKKILRYSNISDIESQKVLSKNIFVKSAYYLKYLFDQFLTSIYLTFFYVFVGKKDYEETVDQKQRDVEKFRVKTFPALAFGLALVFFGILQILMLSGVFVALTYVATAPAYAASYTWDGGGADNNWSTCANWSSDICPIAADSVTFNSTSTKDSTIDASFGGTVTSLTIATGYSGTITVSRSLTLTSVYSQATGTINFGSQTFATADFSLTGGTFTAPSTTMTWTNNVSISGGTFSNNGGTVIFNGGTSAISSCTGVTFNTFSLATATGSKSIASGCTIPLGNNPTIANGMVLSGTITGTGTINGTGGTLSFGATGSISGFTGITGGAGINVTGGTWNFGSFSPFNGGPSIISGGTTTLPSGASYSSNFFLTGGTLNAPSGNMSFGGSVFTISGSSVFNHNNGTVTFNGSTATLSCNNATFNLVSFTGQTGVKTVNSDCSLPLGSNPTVPNGITLNGTLSGTGTLTATTGNLTLNNATGTLSGFSGLNISAFSVSGPTVNLSGYTTFVAGSTVLINSGSLSLPSGADLNGNLTINAGTFTAPSGTMTLAGALTISGSPTFNANGGTISFDGSIATLSCNNVTFNLVSFANNNNAKTVSSNCSLPLGSNPAFGNSVVSNGTLSGTGTITVTAGTLTLNSGSVLSGFNGMSISPASVGGFTVAGATVDLSTYTFSTGASSAVTLSSGTLTMPNNADLNNGLIISGGTFNAPSGTLFLGGALTISGSPTFNANGGTFDFDAGSATLSCNNVTFNSVTFAGQTNTKIVNSNCSLPLGNNPTIPNGITLSGTLSGTGTITNTTGAFTLATGATLTGFTGYTGTTNTFVVGGATANFSSYTTFVIPGTVTLSSGTLTLPNGADLNSTLTVSGGTFNAPSGNMTLANSLTISGSAVFNHNNGTFTFDGAGGTLSCNNVTFNLVSFTGQTGVKVINSNCNLPLGNNPTVPHNITLNGTFSGTGLLTTTTAASSTITLNAGATFSGFSGFSAVNVTYSGAIMSWSSYTSVVITNNFNLSSGTLTLSNTSNTLAAIVVTGATVSQGAGSLSVSGGVVISSGSLTLAPNADLNGSLTISGGTFNAPSGNMTLAGALTISGSPTFNHNNGTLTIDGTIDLTLSCNNVVFNKVIFSHTGGTKTIGNNCAIPLGNDPIVTGRLWLTGTGSSITGTGLFTSTALVSTALLISSGTFSGFSGLIIYGSLAVSGSSLNLSNYSPVEVRGDGATLSLVITAGTFTAPSGTMKLYDAMNFTGGTFNHNNGTVEFATTSSDLGIGVATGALTFNNLKITDVASGTVITLPANITQTISGTLTLKGAAGNLLSLRSSASGSQYSINPANVDITYLDVQDSNNIGPSVIQAVGKNITNSGNNTRWNFDNPSVSSIGPVYLTNGSNIANNKPSYTFNVIDPEVSDTVKYQIQIDNNSDFTSPEVDYTSTIAAQGARTFTVGQAVGSGTYTVGSENQSLADASYFVRIKGIDSTGGDGGYSTVNGASSAFTVDTGKPTGSAIYAYKTDSTSRDIYLIMSATDNLSGVDKMMISENPTFSGASFEEYKTSKAYTVSDGYGTKNIYIKFRDRAGNESISYIVTPSYTQVIVTPSTTPAVTQVPVSYGTPIGGNLTDGLSVLALRVIGSTNAPLANVSINIPSLGINTTTDENGLIVLQNVPLGSYDVLGLFNNKEFNQNLDVSGDQSVITIKLEDSPNNVTVILAISLVILSIIVILGAIYIYITRRSRGSRVEGTSGLAI